MKIFCVTGALDSDLTSVQAILADAGVQAAKPSRLDPDLTISKWHEQLLASADEREEFSSQPPGRLWEQLAGSIFLENMGVPLWGWADRRSVVLLDFWRMFEPNLHFVLVCTSPQRAIGQALSDTSSAPCDIGARLQAWQRHSQAMLQFALRYPERSLLVDAAQCIAAPQALVAACASHWHLALASSQPGAPAATVVSPLADYLAHQMLHDQPEVAALQHELHASLRPLAAQAGATAAPFLHEALDDFKLVRDTAAQLAQQIRLDQEHLARAQQEKTALEEQWQQERQDFSVQLQESKAKILAAQKKASKAEQENAELASSLQALQLVEQERTQLTADLHTAYTSLNAAQNENETQLLQLRQVQGELEHYFFEYQTADNARKEALAAWQRLLARNPDYHDYQTIEADAADAGRVHWRITRFACAGRTVADLRFDTVLQPEGLAWIFSATGEAPAAGLLRWPLPGTSQLVLGTGPGNALGTLAGADLRLLHILCDVLAQALQREEVALDAAVAAALTDALRSYASAIAALPAVLRFDRVHLKREQVNPDYEHLWLTLENLSIGQQRHAQFAFRLSCANVRPQRFGTHPKLEFPADGGRAALEGWFSEAADDFGDKLELRYALPDAMDIGVWKAFSARDHGFLNQLIAQLPAMLADLQQQKIGIARPWSDWEAMVAQMQRIHRDCTGQLRPAANDSNAVAAPAEAIE